MKRKLNSYGDFIKTVMCVQHPKLKAEHRLFLVSIATHAEAKTGRGTYPGRDFLEQATARGWKRVDAYAKHCEALGLIKRTVTDPRRGKRVEWDFCLGNPAYPDLYPGLVTDFGGHDSDDLSGKIGGQAGDQLKSGSGGHVEEVRWSLPQPLVVTSAKLGSQEGDHPSLPPSKETSKHTPTPPAGVSVCEDVKPSAMGDSEVAALLAEFVNRNGGEPGQITAGQRKQLAALAGQHGRDKFRAAARAWLKSQPWDDRTTHPFAAFIAGFEGYAAKMAYVMKHQDRKLSEQLALEMSKEMILFYYMADHEKFKATLTADECEVIRLTLAARSMEQLPAEPMRRDLENRWIAYDKIKRDDGPGPEALTNGKW